MKTNQRKTLCFSVLCGCLLGLTASGQTVIEAFEYADDTELYSGWLPGSAMLSLSTYVAPGAAGSKSMRIDRYFLSTPWDTEVITGPLRPTPLVVAPSQYVTLRMAGDSQFTNATYNMLYVYAYDSANNFGRWGAPVPTSTNWQVFNIQASTIEKPWDSPALPNLGDLVQFKVYVYGQGETPGPEYPAVIHLDEITVRDMPLIEFPPSAPMRALIDDFESYADNDALLTTYAYINSPAATATAATLDTPAPQGNKTLKLAIDFAPGQYPWGSVRSAEVAPFSIPTNAVVQFRIKGDPTLEPLADAGTTFWLSFYDEAGRGFNYSSESAPLIASDWTTVKAGYNQFWSTTAVDTGNLVRWRILVEGWMGTPESTANSGTFYVDDIRITVPPMLTVLREGATLKLQMDNLIPGTAYTLRSTTDFSQWTTTAIQATTTSQTWTVPAGQGAFYQLFYTP